MFSGKTYLLTGASQGIGNHIAHDLARKGARLILVSRNIIGLENLNKVLENTKANHIVIPLDVSNCLMVEQAFINIESLAPQLDGILNCAGSFGTIGKLEDVTPTNFLQSIKVNLLGSYNTSYYGLSSLKKVGRGKIINFSGGGVTNVFPNYSGYSCSKTALVKLTENLAEEYPGIDVNIVAPGFIKTKLAEQTIDAGEKAGSFYQKTIEMLLHGGNDPKNPVDLVSFLLSRESDGISGKLISAQWDNWKNCNFQKKLKDDKDFCSLRRIDDKYFQKMNSDL